MFTHVFMSSDRPRGSGNVDRLSRAFTLFVVYTAVHWFTHCYCLTLKWTAPVGEHKQETRWGDTAQADKTA